MCASGFCACICLSGPIAEECLTGIPYDQQHTSRTDLAMASAALTRLKDPRLDIPSITPFTRLLVDANWPLIQLLANQLILDRELSYDQVVSLIR